MYPGFPENAQEMQKGQITLQEGWAKDAQRMHWRGRRMQKLQGEGCTGGAQAGRRGAGTFEDVIREQSGHLLIPLLHGKQDCE